LRENEIGKQKLLFPYTYTTKQDVISGNYRSSWLFMGISVDIKVIISQAVKVAKK